MKASEENELATCVRRVLARYFEDLDGEACAPVYEMVMACVEKPVLEVVLDNAGHNQSRAAEMLGMNRNTLRKKMQQHGIK